jgi:N-methylhydantoinase A
VLFDNVEGPIETPVYDRSELPAGSELAGPAVIDQLDSTTVIPPGVTARVDEWRNLRLEMPAAS